MNSLSSQSCSYVYRPAQEHDDYTVEEASLTPFGRLAEEIVPERGIDLNISRGSAIKTTPIRAHREGLVVITLNDEVKPACTVTAQVVLERQV
jgi:hypothetical protein